MERLRAQLERFVAALENTEGLRQRLDDLVSVYPFNEYEFIIATLLGSGKLTLDEYYELRDEYLDRNMFLYLFEISAPRGFGEAWAHGHLKEVLPDLMRPSKKLDPDYSGQYDFLLDGRIRIEVKASRAVDSHSNEPIYVKALSSASKKPFDMNFQQIKPACCDVFVWLAVWRDLIRYWVLTSREVESSRFFSKGQHRGNVGEGQLHVTHENIHEFAGYEAAPSQLRDAIHAAYRRQCASAS